MDRLADLIGISRQQRQFLTNFFQQLRFGFIRIGPFTAIPEHDIAIGNVGPHGVTGNFGRADAREVGFDFRDFQNRFLQLKLHIQGLSETGAGYSQCLDGDIALIQVRDKFRTHPRGQCADQNHKDQSRRQYGHAKL